MISIFTFHVVLLVIYVLGVGVFLQATVETLGEYPREATWKKVVLLLVIPVFWPTMLVAYAIIKAVETVKLVRRG